MPLMALVEICNCVQKVAVDIEEEEEEDAAAAEHKVTTAMAMQAMPQTRQAYANNF
jgi:hypothetical protein